MSRRITLLTAFALAAMVVAAPVSASAEEWLHEGEPLPEAEEAAPIVPLTGGITIYAPGKQTGFTCTVHLEAKLFRGKTGLVFEEELTTKTCIGFGAFQNCTMVSDTPIGIPWVVHIVSKTKFVLAAFLYHFKLNPGCAIQEVVVDIPEIEAEVDDPEGISYVTLSGIGSGGVEIGGELTMSPAGTYEIG